MAKLKIDGVEYEMPEKLELDEQALFKRHAGLLMGDLAEAMGKGDPEAIMVLCMIVKHRAHEACTLEQAGKITDFEFIEEAQADNAGAIPPVVPAPASPLSMADAETPNPSSETAAIRAVGGTQS